MKKHRSNKPMKKAVIVVLLVIIGTIFFQTGFFSGRQDNPSGNETDTSWNLILVNKDHAIPENYDIELMELSNRERIDARIYPELQAMFNDARANGLHLFVRAGYRTEKEQQKIMDNKIKEFQKDGYSKREATALAEEYVAIPGTSEHQLGLSVDINADTSQCSSDSVYKWLDENAYKYGFVKRYPADKTEITGISYEPWHYRYVGAEAAKEMKEKGLCLEEYLQQ